MAYLTKWKLNQTLVFFVPPVAFFSLFIASEFFMSQTWGHWRIVVQKYLYWHAAIPPPPHATSTLPCCAYPSFSLTSGMSVGCSIKSIKRMLTTGFTFWHFCFHYEKNIPGIAHGCQKKNRRCLENDTSWTHQLSVKHKTRYSNVRKHTMTGKPLTALSWLTYMWMN